jgi:heterodisulfide reductase subunit A
LGIDTIIIAVSQSPEISYAGKEDHLKLTKWNTIVVDKESMKTETDGVFAGGDVVHGPDAVITAMGDGKRAAESIHKYIKGEPLEGFKTRRCPSLPERDENDRPHRYSPPFKDIPKQERTEMKELDPNKRIRSFQEVELGYTEEEAKKEASRCLNCGLCVECHVCETV